MASTSPASTQSASSASGTPNTLVIVSVVVGVVVAFLAGIIIFRWYLRRRKAQPRRQNTLELRTNDKLTSNFYVRGDRFQISSPLLDDRKRKEESDYTARHHAIYEPPSTHASYDPPYRSEERDHFPEEERGHTVERSTSPGFPNPHSPTVTLSRLVIPEFKPLAVMEVLDASFNSSPTSEGVGSSHVSATPSAATESPQSAYSQVPAPTGRSSYFIAPPVPPIPDKFKSTVANDPTAITRTNTRAIGLMLKERAKRLKPDTRSRSPSPVSPIERSGSIKSTYSHIVDREDEKPSLKSRIAAQRKRTLPTPQMEPLLEVPNSAVSTSTTSSFPLTSWQFPAPPAPPAPTFYPTHPAAPLSSMSQQLSPEQLRAVDVPYADISPLKILNARDRVTPPAGAEEMPPWSDRRVHFRASAEKALDVSHPVTRFQSTYGEIEYHHS
jgi:hypothetical protein